MTPPPKPVPQAVDHLLASYTAGLVDGEGSIQINPSRNRAAAQKAYWCLSVQISSVSDGFLETLREEWGGVGSLTYWHSRGSLPNRRVCNWRFYSAEAEWFLGQVLPWLRIKKSQAEVALEFRRYRSPKRDSLTPEMSERRQQLAEQMRALNARTGKATAKPRTSQPL